ncbi:hypothetical protein ABVK25_006745 [Lepraria finkii]|uniref:Uncharacterized protein n=1 Tax=Lepraria finkii TaxID=1340010 RepID=A0ABR4BB78_9LECA
MDRVGAVEEAEKSAGDKDGSGQTSEDENAAPSMNGKGSEREKSASVLYDNAQVQDNAADNQTDESKSAEQTLPKDKTLNEAKLTMGIEKEAKFAAEVKVKTDAKTTSSEDRKVAEVVATKKESEGDEEKLKRKQKGKPEKESRKKQRRKREKGQQKPWQMRERKWGRRKLRQMLKWRRRLRKSMRRICTPARSGRRLNGWGRGRSQIIRWIMIFCLIERGMKSSITRDDLCRDRFVNSNNWASSSAMSITRWLNKHKI